MITDTNAPSLNTEGAVVTHYDFGPTGRDDNSPLCGFTGTDADGFTRDWSAIDCADCLAANDPGLAHPRGREVSMSEAIEIMLTAAAQAEAEAGS